MRGRVPYAFILLLLIGGCLLGILLTFKMPTIEKLRELNISGPWIAEVGDNVTFTVTSGDRFVQGAKVTVDESSGFTDSEGNISFRFEKVGAYRVVASKEGYGDAYTLIQIYPRGNEAIKIRGLRWPNPYSLRTATLHEMRMAGANYVAFKVNYFIEEDGSLVPIRYTWFDAPRCTSEELKKLATIWINHAHNYKLNVMIVIWLWWPERTNFYEWVYPNKQKFLDEYEKVLLEWAEFATEHKVEMFTWEACRVTDVLGWEGSSKWHQAILPKLREVFKGDIVLGFQDFKQFLLNNQTPPAFNYTGYDYVGIDLWNDQNLPATVEEMESIVESTLRYCEQLKGEYNVKVILTWLQCYRIFKGYEDEPENGKLRFLEMAMNKSIGVVDGMFVNTWDYRISCQYHLNAEKMLFVWQGRGVYELVKKYYAKPYESVETIKATIVIDGKADDWRKLSPICLDPPNTALYVTNDKYYIYIMIQSLKYTSLPKSEYKLWIDVDLDGKLDYNINLTPDHTDLEKITYTYEKFAPFEASREMKHTFISDLQYAWEDVAEIKIPLHLIMDQEIENKTIAILATEWGILMPEWGLKEAINTCGEGLVKLLIPVSRGALAKASSIICISDIIHLQ